MKILNNLLVSDISGIGLKAIYGASGFFLILFLHLKLNEHIFSTYVLLFAGIEIFGSIIKMGFPTILLREVSKKRIIEKDINLKFESINGFYITLLLISFFSWIFLYEYVSENFKYLFFIVPCSVVMNYGTLFFNLLRANGKFNSILIFENCFKNIIIFIGTLFLLNILDINYIFGIVFFAISFNTLCLILITYSLKIKFTKTYNFNFFFINKEAARIMIFNFLQVLPKQGIFYFFSFLGQTKFIGDLRIALSLFNFIRIPVIIFSAKYSPLLTNFVSNLKYYKIYSRKNFSNLTISIVVFVIAFYLVPLDFFTLIIKSDNVSEIVFLAKLISISIIVDSISSLNSTLILMKKKDFVLIKNYFISFSISSILFYILIFLDYNKIIASSLFFIIYSIISNFLNNLFVKKYIGFSFFSWKNLLK